MNVLDRSEFGPSKAFKAHQVKAFESWSLIGTGYSFSSVCMSQQRVHLQRSMHANSFICRFSTQGFAILFFSLTIVFPPPVSSTFKPWANEWKAAYTWRVQLGDTCNKNRVTIAENLLYYKVIPCCCRWLCCTTAPAWNHYGSKVTCFNTVNKYGIIYLPPRKKNG